MTLILEYVILALLIFNTYCHLRWKLSSKRFDPERYQDLLSKLYMSKYQGMSSEDQAEFERLTELRRSLRTTKFDSQVGYVTDHIEAAMRWELIQFRVEMLSKIDDLIKSTK